MMSGSKRVRSETRGAEVRWIVAVGAALALVAGCGPSDGIARVSVSGKVTLDGKPLPSGQIVFLPEQTGPSASAAIHDGAYTIGASEGPAAGSHRVEVYSVQPTGRMIPNPDDATQKVEETRSVIPTRYNANSMLRAEVKPRTENTFDFPLTSGSRTR